MKYKGRDINELTEAEKTEALRDTLMKLNYAMFDLVAIRTGVGNVPPENPDGEWGVRKIATLRDAKEYAETSLKRLGYRNPNQ